ncbi:squalene epoxidase [Eremomyces bilateralis CBS 781.70]|uniref:Squalene monooxygenase n=1 Tax=Eremomyces bilateralis CBS 781.70 TaxID=1392243 RepID=A0A6G1FSC9_9PEZI|nr:squalene epoxidase [Eremomyces bilateralis CBS 781.70]KAF1808618.1 squalene epoxidase [Eremomyces bilateralis CBS 781.70]
MPLILDSAPSSTSSEDSPDAREERRRLHHEADVVIIGAGVAGCAMAVALGKQGRSVILLEKSLKEPDRIVGELLQPGGVVSLDQLGLLDCLEDIDAIRVTGYTIFYFGEKVFIPYPANASALPDQRPEGRSFHHGRFIQKLRSAASATPNVTIVETTAVDLVKNGWTGQVLGVECESKDKKDCYFGHLTVVADGYASKFRKSYISRQPQFGSRFWGLELKNVKLPSPGHGHVILGDGAPILLYQIGSNETRALVDIPEGCPTATIAAGGVKSHLLNHALNDIPEQVQPAFKEALEKGALRSMPNSYLPPTSNRTPGLLILGDAHNMRHPLTGGGMTVAFNDVVVLRDLLAPEKLPNFEDTKAVLKALKSWHWRRKNLTVVINILAQALYSLFAADDADLKALQLGCFAYFQLGGMFVDGPVSLLAGIIHNPFVLFMHFFAVALYSMWIYATKWNILLMPVALAMSGTIFLKACVVIFPYIFSELRS